MGQHACDLPQVAVCVVMRIGLPDIPWGSSTVVLPSGAHR